ncbi:MAG: 50S ribosomal protein L22 [Candidatus Sungbacteria bacterium RIFCSPLOWO2_01_FULL_59_16]|uniref:Large ribosomal subunit protein uL22 n=1 Tax=Candidatus Sungbacteria bacterium RIFCSPLOWO2_01_FULL_59_16 TaxID=1802280 RepID=A0A1G2LDU3_9BACT|nr:MAG: 50S ribosomal protein L22 [Candidatus Sungbacteria bacterium RIFCSPLOWO2_01_FULL_59_16]
MKISAELNYLRMAPRKVRLAADAIRGKRVPEAEVALRFLARRSAVPLRKLLASAVASAKHDYQMASSDALIISEIRVDGGPILKRRRAGARGTSFPIAKRTSHIRLVLEASGVAPKRARRRAAPVAVRAASGRVEAAPDESAKAAPARRAFRERMRMAAKPREFVRRIFRRKVI